MPNEAIFPLLAPSDELHQARGSKISGPVNVNGYALSRTTVRCATTGNIAGVTTAPGAAIDTVTMQLFDRFLVKDQNTPAENGVYVWLSATRAVRAPDFRQGVTGGVEINVQDGAENGGTDWALQNIGIPTIDTTPLYFSRIYPDYQPGAYKGPWNDKPANPLLLENVPKDLASSTLALALTRIYMFGGLVIPAGRPFTGVQIWNTNIATNFTAGGRWVAIVRQSDRVVLAVSTNITTAMTQNAWNPQPFTSVYTPPRDIPIYVCWCGSGVTGPTTLATPALNASAAQQAPIRSGWSSTAGSSSPPAVGAALGAITSPGNVLTQQVRCGLY